jgi:hypothetical protein
MEEHRVNDVGRSLRGLTVLILMAATLCSAGYAQISNFCWRDTSTRGAGQVLDTNTCGSPNLEKDPNGLLCYPKCNAGFKGVGPACWQSCPSGFRDDGAFCAKPEAYGRGAGYAWQFGDAAFSSSGQWSRCQGANPQGCEQPGGGITLVYPKCKPNFHAVGTNICSPDCPAGMPDGGVSCQKASYGRGAGEILGCPAGLERSGLLCYAKCKAHSDGVGPVCWDQCPANWVQCGMGCAKNVESCGTAVTDQVVSVVSAVAAISAEILTAGAAAGIVDASKAGSTAAQKTPKEATEEAVKMVEKLHLQDAFKNAQKGGITKDVVATAMKKVAVPSTKLEVAKMVADNGAKLPSTIATIADISQDEHLTEAQKQFQIAQTVLDVAGAIDPTGITAIVSAYTKPTCSLVFANATTPTPTDTATTSPKWTALPGTALSIGANAKGDVWLIGNASGADHPIYRKNGTTWQLMPGGGTRIAVDPAGNAWVVNSAGAIYHFTGTAWQKIAGPKSIDIGVGANGSVWVIGADYSISRLTVPYNSPGPYEWQAVPGGGLRIAVGPDGNPWVVNAAHEIYHSNGSSWSRLPGTATSIAIDAGGVAFVAGVDGNVYRWAGTNWTQEGVAGENLAGGAAGIAYLSKNAAGANAMMIRTP